MVLEWHTLSAKNFGAKNFGGKFFGGQNFGGFLPYFGVNFGEIGKNFGANVFSVEYRFSFKSWKTGDTKPNSAWGTHIYTLVCLFVNFLRTLRLGFGRK